MVYMLNTTAIKYDGVEIPLRGTEPDDITPVLVARWSGRKAAVYVTPEAKAEASKEALAVLSRWAREVKGSIKRTRLGLRFNGKCVIYLRGGMLNVAATNPLAEGAGRAFRSVIDGRWNKCLTTPEANNERAVLATLERHRENLASLGLLIPRKAPERHTPTPALPYGLLDT